MTLYEQRWDHLRNLTTEILRDLARNDSAPHEWRLAALELLVEKHAPYVNHPDLAPLMLEIKRAEQKARAQARSEVEAIVEQAIETDCDDVVPQSGPPPATSGPPAASVTTRSLTQDEVVLNEDQWPKSTSSSM